MVVGTVRGEESRMRERRPDPRRDFTCRWLRPNICTTRRKPARGNIVARLLKDTHYRIETITSPPCVCVCVCVCHRVYVPSCVCVCICANKAGSPRRLPPLFLSLPFKPTALVSKLIAAAQGSRWKIGAVHALTRIKDSTRCFLPFLSFFFFCFSFFPPSFLRTKVDWKRCWIEWITLDEKWDGRRIDDCCRFLVFSILFEEYSGIFFRLINFFLPPEFFEFVYKIG